MQAPDLTEQRRLEEATGMSMSEVRALAAKTETYAKFMRATGWDIHAVRAANEKHNLGLVPVRGGKGKPAPGVACPKPAKKGGKGE